VRPTMAGRRRSDGHAGAGSLRFYTRPSKAVCAAPLHRHVRCMGTAWWRACAEYGSDAIGQAAHSRLGLSKARTVHGTRGVGKERRCGARGPAARGPAGQGRPRQECTAAGGAAFVAPASRHRTRRRALWCSRGKTFRTSPVPLRFSQEL
jgi:hypothetical protein